MPSALRLKSPLVKVLYRSAALIFTLHVMDTVDDLRQSTVTIFQILQTVDGNRETGAGIEECQPSLFSNRNAGGILSRSREQEKLIICPVEQTLMASGLRLGPT